MENFSTRAHDPRVLICDEHDNHLNGSFVEHRIDNNIELVILLTPHILLSLSISACLVPSRNICRRKPSHSSVPKSQHCGRLNGWEYMLRQETRLFQLARSWNGAGLVPFNPQKVLHRVSSPIPTPPPTPCSTNNPFENVSISDSPVDIAAL
jgi:hypothetical protein